LKKAKLAEEFFDMDIDGQSSAKGKRKQRSAEEESHGGVPKKLYKKLPSLHTPLSQQPTRKSLKKKTEQLPSPPLLLMIDSTTDLGTCFSSMSSTESKKMGSGSERTHSNGIVTLETPQKCMCVNFF
jgi:hypothetical protein